MSSKISSKLQSLLLPFPNHPLLPLLLSPSPLPNPLLLHAFSIASSLLLHPLLASRVLSLCLLSSPSYAPTLFRSVPSPDLFTLNSLIPHFPVYFSRIRSHGLVPDALSFALLLKATVTCLNSSRMVHSQVVRCGAGGSGVVRNSLIKAYCGLGVLEDARKVLDESVELDVVAFNTLVSAYGRVGDVWSAREVFDGMPDRNLVSWGAMVDGYVRNGEFGEALRVFREMQDEGSFKPDAVLLVSVLKACAHLGALDQGLWVHLYVRRNGLELSSNVVLATALVDMYCRCGCLAVALEIFDRVACVGDVVLCNAMIGGLALHGHARDALDLFGKMRNFGVAPNESTFIAVLYACTHGGLVKEGIALFKSMKADHNIEPRRDHYGSLADLLGRAGLLEEAEDFLLGMPMDAEASQWGALMGACQMHRNVQVGERVGKRLIALEPNDGGRYVSLSNVYAISGKWDDAWEARETMEAMGIKKETGCSFIECNGVVYEFIVGDTRHEQVEEIYKMLRGVERWLVMVE